MTGTRINARRAGLRLDRIDSDDRNRLMAFIDGVIPRKDFFEETKNNYIPVIGPILAIVCLIGCPSDSCINPIISSSLLAAQFTRRFALA